MKKVLEIINLPGSAINFIGGQFKYLREEGGYDMHLICSQGEDVESFCKENEVHYYPVELRRQVSVWKDIVALWKICKYIKTNHIDIVIAHQSKARLLGMIACVLTRVKHRIIFSHGILYETMTGVKRWLIIQNEKLTSCLATKVVCVSHYVKNQRIKDGVDKPSKQVILGRGSCNGIDTINKFNPNLIDKDLIEAKRLYYGINRNDFVVGFCGRLVRDKGVIELIEAFEELKESPTVFPWGFCCMFRDSGKGPVLCQGRGIGRRPGFPGKIPGRCGCGRGRCCWPGPSVPAVPGKGHNNHPRSLTFC